MSCGAIWRRLHGARGHLILHKGGEGVNASEGVFCSFGSIELPSSLSLSTNPVLLYFYDARFSPKRAILLFWWEGGGGREGEDSDKFPLFLLDLHGGIGGPRSK